LGGVHEDRFHCSECMISRSLHIIYYGSHNIVPYDFGCSHRTTKINLTLNQTLSNVIKYQAGYRVLFIFYFFFQIYYYYSSAFKFLSWFTEFYYIINTLKYYDINNNS